MRALKNENPYTNDKKKFKEFSSEKKEKNNNEKEKNNNEKEKPLQTFNSYNYKPVDML